MGRGSKRQWYVVRIREKLPDGSYRKISKFYNEIGPAEARSHYHGEGLIMHVEKASRRVLGATGAGGFFKTAEQIMKDLRRLDDEQDVVSRVLARENKIGGYDAKGETSTDKLKGYATGARPT